MAPFPVITRIEGVAPTHGIAKRVFTGLDIGAVVLVMLHASVDAFVEALHYALHVSSHTADVKVAPVAEFAEAVGCAAVGYGADGVVRGGAVAEECGLGAVCWAEDGGRADGLSCRCGWWWWWWRC